MSGRLLHGRVDVVFGGMKFVKGFENLSVYSGKTSVPRAPGGFCWLLQVPWQ